MRKRFNIAVVFIFGLLLTSCNIHIHSYDELVDEVQSTCTEKGYKEYKCSCGKTKNEIIPTINHNYEFKERIGVTCTNGGYDLFECEMCKKEKTEAVQALGHDPIIPSEGKYFIFDSVCSRCGIRCGEEVVSLRTYDDIFVYNFNNTSKDGITKETIDASVIDIKNAISSATKYNENTDKFIKDSELYDENKLFEEKYNVFCDYLDYVTEQYQYAYVFYCVNEDDSSFIDAYDDISGYRSDLIKEYYLLFRLIYETKYREYFFSYEDGWTDDDIRKVLILSDSYGSDEYAQKNKIIDQILIDYRKIENPSSNLRVNELYKRLIDVNNEIASLAGYDNYMDYAYENDFDRAYSKENAREMTNYVKTYLGNETLLNIYKALLAYEDLLTDEEIELYFSFNESVFDSYEAASALESYFKNLKSDSYEKDIDFYNEADELFKNGNYYFGKYDGAFSYYIPNVDETILYFNKENYSNIYSFIHEFGHYYENIYNKGIDQTMDLMEIHSQGNEMLFLAYLKEYLKDYPNLYKVVVLEHVFDKMTTILSACSINEFEDICYTLEYDGTDEIILSILSDKIIEESEYDILYEAICEPYGLNMLYYPTYWRYVTIEAPAYYISYSMSAIPSIQIYAKAIDEGFECGKDTYLNLFAFTDDENNYTLDGNDDKIIILNFEEILEYVGLSSPFAKETYEELKSIIFELIK